MREILLVTLNGRDAPGLTAAFTQTLAEHAVNVLDIGQAVIHDWLNLGMLIEIPDAAESGAVMKELLFLAHQRGLELLHRLADGVGGRSRAQAHHAKAPRGQVQGDAVAAQRVGVVGEAGDHHGARRRWSGDRPRRFLPAGVHRWCR